MSQQTNFKQPKIKQGLEQGLHIVNEARLDPLFQATQRIFKDADLLSNIAEAKKNCLHTQGWTFEQLEVLKFNQDAVAKAHYDIFAQTTDSMGQPHAAADIIIQNNRDQVLDSAQVKSYQSAAKSAFALADEKYQGMQRIAPVEQTQQIDDLYQQRIDSNSLKSVDYQDAKKHLKEGLSHGEISSGGTSRQEAINAADVDKVQQIVADYKTESLITEIHRTGHQAGMLGAAMGGGASLLSNSYQLLSSENSTNLSDFLIKTTTTTVKSYTTSYVTSATARGIAHVAQAHWGEAAATGLIKSNAHIALATGTVKAGKAIARFLVDDSMSKEQLYNEISHTALTGASAFYYAAVGQALIPIPLVGAFVGSTVGYYMANLLHQSGLFALGEAARVKVARERREQVEQLCLMVIPQMRAARIELENLFIENRIARKKFVDDIFLQMDAASLAADPQQYLDAISKLHHAFGGNLGFSSFEEFDAQMNDDDMVFEL